MIEPLGVLLLLLIVLVVLLVLVVAALRVQVKLLEADGHRRGHRGQAARALARERRDRGPGGEDALGYRLEPDLECDVSPGRYLDKLQAQVIRRGNGPRLGQRGPRLTAKLAHVKDKRPSGCMCACAGHDSVLAQANGNRAHSLPAVRGIPHLAHRAGIPAGPAPASYSSARRSRSRDRTISGTRPLPPPPYLAISLTRLELRKE